MEVEFLNITKNFAAFKNGVILPITDYFDANGDECAAIDAVVCVAGSDEFGWLEIAISPAAEKVSLQ